MTDFKIATDGRQSDIALEIQRGTMRLLRAHSFAPLPEHVLANGRRADIIGVSDKGAVWIVEIKSSIEDFRADHKWPDYQDYCDKLFFAVKPDFPTEILPETAGLILADRFGGEVMRDTSERRLPAPRRKAITLSIARSAALRLNTAWDPDAFAKADAWRAPT